MWSTVNILIRKEQSRMFTGTAIRVTVLRAVPKRGSLILQKLSVRGVRPFFSDKVDITANEMYKELSDFDKKNQFDIEKYVSEYGKPKFSKII